MFPAGKRRLRLKLQQLTDDQDSIGEPVKNWTDITPVWGSILHLSGAETIKADTPTSVVRASVRISYRTGIDASMRFLYQGRAYMIKALLPDDNGKRHIDCACEVVNAEI